ncbi:MAG: GldG family protein, partial [Myxococcota bacterium]
MRPGPTRSSLLAEHRVVTAGWVALALLAVHLAAAIPVRLDLTRDGRYALSDAAREVVGGLDREVIANVYFTAPLDPPYHTHEAAVLDLLAELDAASGGAIRVTVADPGDDPAIRDQAAALGVTPVPYTLRTRDRVEARSVYLGVAITAGDRTVAIPALPSIPRMEYELVRAIRAVTTDPDDRPTIGWWLGHGEADPATAPAGSPLRTVRERLAERGTVRTVTGGDVPIPDDVDLLVIAAPRDPVSAVETVHLDQFVMRGGRVLVFASSFRIDFARGAPVPVDHGLYAWLGGLGVRANRDLLLDRTHNEVLAVPIGDRWVKVNHPLAPTTANLDRG